MAGTKPPVAESDLADVSDNPEWTPEEFARAVSGVTFLSPEVLQDLERQGTILRRTRGPQKSPTKVDVHIKLDRSVVEHFKSSGRGWQTRLNEALVEVVGRGKGRS